MSIGRAKARVQNRHRHPVTERIRKMPCPTRPITTIDSSPERPTRAHRVGHEQVSTMNEKIRIEYVRVDFK
jgi:hypothetical protein